MRPEPELNSIASDPANRTAQGMNIDTKGAREAFARDGFVNLGRVLAPSEVARFGDLFETDRRKFPYFWHPYGYHQQANYDALITTPAFDGLIRHPKILPVVESLMGGDVCFGEIGLRRMPAYDGAPHQQWHRDRAHLAGHPLRLDYMQLMVYLTDVDATTHCFSLSPESVDEPVLSDNAAQLRRGVYDLHGPAGHLRAVQRRHPAHRHDAPHHGGTQDRADLLRSPGPRTARQRLGDSRNAVARP